MIIRARAPLRLGFGGGGTDVSPYCDTYGGYVLNATIDRYAYAVIKVLDTNVVRFIATDLQKQQELPLASSYVLDQYLDLHKAVYNEIVKNYNFNKSLSIEVTTFCDAPAGSGLGSSSTLVVAMVRAYMELLNLPLDDYTIAQLAYKIERIDCGQLGGRQDQFSATFGGFNFMEFYAENRAVVNSLRIKNWIICELEASLILFYTGVSRESAKIIHDQSSKISQGSNDTLQAMHSIKEEAVHMKECLLRGHFDGYVESMRQGWISKKNSSKTVSTPIIEEIHEAAIKSGALAGKVSGAGGGGFMMFFVPTDKRMNLIRTLEKFDGKISNCHFTKHGSQAWRIPC